MKHQTLTPEHQFELLRSKTSIKDNQYQLAITAPQASSFGIGSSEFDTYIQQLHSINKIILEATESSDDSYQAILQQVTYPSGELDTSGQEERTVTVFVPFDARFVRFQYISNSLPAAAVICRTRALGGWIASTGVTFAYYGSTDVNLDASNTFATKSFRTWDPNGARCTWTVHP